MQVNDILKKAADISLGRARQHLGHAITWDVAELPEIIGNATALRTVFVNLFINAWDALDRSGEISVTSRREEGVWYWYTLQSRSWTPDVECPLRFSNGYTNPSSLPKRRVRGWG